MKAWRETLVHLAMGENEGFTSRAPSGSMHTTRVIWSVGSPSVKTEGFNLGRKVEGFSAFEALPEKVREALKNEAFK